MSHRMTSVRLSMLAQTSILLQGPSRKSHARAPVFQRSACAGPYDGRVLSTGREPLGQLGDHAAGLQLVMSAGKTPDVGLRYHRLSGTGPGPSCAAAIRRLTLERAQ